MYGPPLTPTVFVDPVTQGLLSTFRVLFLTYALVALVVALGLAVAMAVQMLRDPDEWRDLSDALWRHGSDPGTALALIAVAWPLILARMIRDAVAPE